VLLAYRCALASPRVSAAAIEATEFPVDADRTGVLAVPTIVVDGRSGWAGSVPEPVFVDRVTTLAGAGVEATG
jgi:predicted DsbA family dithiol-disulfide isomerase